MPGIKDRVAIIGMGCTQFGELWDKSVSDLIIEAAYEAFEDAGIKPGDIQAGWLGHQFSYVDRAGQRGSMLSYPLKLEYIPVTHVENACATGLDALRNASYAVAAGIYDLVLVVGVEKLKDTGFAGIPQAGALVYGSHTEPLFPAPTGFAMAATRYFHRYGLGYEEGKRILAKIAVKNHHNGTLAPKAHFRREITLEQAINAPMISWPLGLFDCCGTSDGATAAILTTPELARKYRKDYVLVKALSICTGALQAQLQDDYDMTHFEEAYRAGVMAYKEAGISEPRRELSLAQVHDCFTITELLTYEDLQLSPRGKATEDVAADTFTLQGALPVNTDGGLKCFGHPIGATGLRQTYENYKQLQGKAEKRQVKNARLALSHNIGGNPGSFSVGIGIFGRAE